MNIQLSIIIANYNYGRFLSDAIASIERQCLSPVADGDGRAALPVKNTDAFVEIIVCDACSTDNSLEVIKRHEKSIAWWISEPDKGQSDAFNKGFAHANGEYLTWLNADEIYTSGAFVALDQHIKRHNKPEWITANDYAFLDIGHTIEYICWGPHVQLRGLKAAHLPCVAFGPSSFIRRDVWNRVGLFDVDIHYGMDMTYWRRLTNAGFRQSRLNRFCWGFRIHKGSKTAGDQTEVVVARRRMEDAHVATTYGAPFKMKWSNPWYTFWMLCRLIDGSLIVNLCLRLYLKGKNVHEVWNGKLWREK